MKSRHVFTVVVFAALLSACGSDDLTKDQAKSLVTAYLDQHPTTKQLATGMTSMGQASEKDYFATPGGKYQKALEADGLITIVSKGKISNPSDRSQYINALDIALTDKGKTLVTGKPVTAPAPPPQWPTVYENAVFCGKELVSLADVNSANDSATVEYTWKAAKLTPFAEDSHKTDPGSKSTCDTSKVESASAAFERKDNVWKITVGQ